MREQIDELKKKLDELAKEYEKIQREVYKQQQHKVFKEGDWVKGNGRVGIVGWVKNKGMNIHEADGYFGLDIKNGNLGFSAPCKRDEYELLIGTELEYYTNAHPINLMLTGEQIEDILYYIENRHSKGLKILIDVLNKKRNRVTK